MTLECTYENTEYILSFKKKEDVKCPICSEEMLKDLNENYVDKKNTSITKKNIQAYFKNKNGSCKNSVS